MNGENHKTMSQVNKVCICKKRINISSIYMCVCNMITGLVYEWMDVIKSNIV